MNFIREIRQVMQRYPYKTIRGYFYDFQEEEQAL